MNDAWIKRQTATTEARRCYEQERLLLWVTDKITEAMENVKVSKADMARELGTSRANITGVLSGGRNMTLRTLADLGFVLGQRIEISLEPLRDGLYTSAPVHAVRPIRPQIVGAESPELMQTGGDVWRVQRAQIAPEAPGEPFAA